MTKRNEPYTAQDDDVTIYNVKPTEIAVLANDHDDDLTDARRITDYDPAPGLTTDKGGTVWCSTSVGGRCRYTPPPGYNGPFPLDDEFRYSATDGISEATTATVTIHLKPCPIAGPEPPPPTATSRRRSPCSRTTAIPTAIHSSSVSFDTAGTAGECRPARPDRRLPVPPPERVLGDGQFTYTIEDDRGGNATGTVSSG